MDRTVLPQGVTFNERGTYVNGENNRSALDILETIKIPSYEKAIKKPQKLGKRAFKHVRQPGKLQRVSETIIYDQERVKQMEMEKYHVKYRQHLESIWPTESLADAIIVAIGVDKEWKTTNDVVEIFNQVNEKVKRTITKFGRNSLGYAFTAYLRGERALSIFIEKKKVGGGKKGVAHYRITDMGLKIGPRRLLETKTMPMSKNYDTMRLRLGHIKQYAKGQGVSEDEFYSFLGKRRLELNRVAEIERPEKSHQEQIIDALKEGADKPEYKPTEINDPDFDREPAVKIPDPEYTSFTTIDDLEKIEGKQQIQEIELDLKIWFVPVTGTIRIK